MYLIEPTEEAKAAARKKVTVVEYEDGGVSIRYRGVPLAARPFHKDGCVTQGILVDRSPIDNIRYLPANRDQQLRIEP